MSDEESSDHPDRGADGRGDGVPEEATFRSARDRSDPEDARRPGPLRASDRDDEDAPPTSDTIAAHRAAGRRARQIDAATIRTAPIPDADARLTRGARLARVPQVPAVAAFGARSATPVMAERGPTPQRDPQEGVDGNRIEQSLRAAARRRVVALALAAAAVSAGGAVLLGILLLAGAPGGA